MKNTKTNINIMKNIKTNINIMKNKKTNVNITSVVPIRSYLNPYKQKEEICMDNENKSGVYRWVNKINGKSYVSSSAFLDRKILLYYCLSSLKSKVKGSTIIYRALLKYGYCNFTLDILEYCKPNELITREQYYVNLIKPEYNISKKIGTSS